MGSSSSKDAEPKSLRPHVLRTENDQAPRSALILGPTGATGKFIVSYLVRSPEWSKVTIVHRREVDLDEIAKKTGVTFDESQKSKVTQHVVDMEKMCDEDQIAENVTKFQGNDVTFCVLGTTRGKAGSAEAFRKVDHYMVRDGAILSKKAGVGHFSLLTSMGAKAGLWASDWKISHGLLYLKVKGQAEQSVIDQKFGRVSFFRPGALARREVEGDHNVGGGMISKLDVRDLAAAMVYDAESDEVQSVDPVEEKKEEETAQNDIVYYEGSNIKAVLPLAKANYDLVCAMQERQADSTLEEKQDEKQDEQPNEQTEEKEVENQEKELVDEPVKEQDADVDDGADDNFEVVDKPEDASVPEDDTKNEDFVEVDKKDVEKANIADNE